jgi:hypothetical protein
MNLTALDLQQARIKQILFKSQLRSVLYGVREPDEALFSAGSNALSQWLQTVVKPQYSHRAEMKDVERKVGQMLETGRDLVAQYRRGQIEESRVGLSRIDVFAEQILGLLQKLAPAAV